MPNSPLSHEATRRPSQAANTMQPSAKPVTGPQTQSYRFSDQRLIQHFEIAIASSASIDALLANIARIVSDQSDCLGLWACQANEQGEFGSPRLLSQPEGDALWEVIEDHARQMIQRVTRTRQICSSPIRSKSNTSLVVAPVSSDLDQSTPVHLVLLGCFSGERQSVLRQQWLVGLASQAIARWHQYRLLKHQENKTRSLNDTIGLVHSLDQTTSLSEAAVVVVNHLRRLSQADQVAFSFCERPGVGKLQAVSDVEHVDFHSESGKITSNACNQAILLGQPLCFPATKQEHSAGLLALDKYCKSNGFEACLNLPLKTDDGRTIV
jgi:hypothetical protein